MIDKCLVKIISNKVVCDTANELKRHESEKREKMDEMIKNKRKMNHLVGIGMDLHKYHPTVLRTMIDGGRNFKIPDDLKYQLINFANEAHVKGFNPSLFGYNTTLHKFIKTVHKIPKRKYVRKMMPTFDGKGNIDNIELKVIEEDEPINNSESETDLDDILSEVEDNITEGRIEEVKMKLKQYKHRIPKDYYKKIMKSI
jgi:hypothetical protein